MVREEIWIDELIRAKTESGELAPSVGVGVPIPDLDRRHDPLWWVRKWVEREGLDDATGPRSGEETARS